MEDLNLLSDETLVSLFAKGENSAFDELLQRHQNRIFSYILNIVKDKELADDLFQETFVKAIVTIKQGRYTENGKFLAWIMRIAHNLTIDFFRQEKQMAQVSCDNEDIDILNRKELSEETIEDSIVRHQILADVKVLVQSLPELQREVLEMRYYQHELQGNRRCDRSEHQHRPRTYALRNPQPSPHCQRAPHLFVGVTDITTNGKPLPAKLLTAASRLHSKAGQRATSDYKNRCCKNLSLFSYKM